jgi:hypothetical protein
MRRCLFLDLTDSLPFSSVISTELLDNNAAGGARFVIDLSTITTLEETTERCYGVPPPQLSRGSILNWTKIMENAMFLISNYYWLEPGSSLPFVFRTAGVALLAGAGVLAYKRFTRK